MSTFHQHQIPEITVHDVEDGSADAVLLDVRNANEWEAGHAPGALWIPLPELERARMELPFNKPVQCICRSGQRSARAAESLIEWGFDASNVVGGMKAWEAAGLPVVRDDGSDGTVA
jgi:rhodanese-related sulfurtransferase